jgi:hypothetical protein
MPSTLRLFISYAREDEKIADAVRAALTKALPTPLAFVDMDKYTIDVGADFAADIQDKLDKAHVLVIVYTGRAKQSFGYTGQELGYFRSQKKLIPVLDEIPRKIVSVFLGEPPPSTANINGVGINISQTDLDCSEEQYRTSLQIGHDHAFVQFLKQMQSIVEDIWRREKYPGRAPTEERDPVECARSMYLEIFKSLKAGVDLSRSTRPQRQLTIATTDADLEAYLPDLPPTAVLSPGEVGGAMAIFGLPEAPITWNEFGTQTERRKYGPVWRDAIRAVAVSSIPDQVSVDNGQIIFSHDDGELYRIILTSALRYFDGRREFKLYFVEGLRRTDFGTEETSLLLKGLELVCRYRFMFLEPDSPFVQESIEVAQPERLFELAASAIRELDWMKRDARDARLDDTATWARLIGGYGLIKKMGAAYYPHEKEVRELAIAIHRTKAGAGDLVELRAKLAKAVGDLGQATDALNKAFMVKMMERLQHYVEEQSRQPEAATA